MTRPQSDPPPPEGARPAVSPDPHRWAQEVLSAAADGEQADEIALGNARRHALGCRECGRFAERLGPMKANRTRPDPAGRTVMGTPPPALRWALAVSGLVNVAIGLPLLVGVDPFGAAGVGHGHLTRDGALAVVLGAVALACARQPRFGRSLSPIALAIVALHLLGGGTDVVDGTVTWAFEATHLLNAFTAGLVVAASLWSRPPKVVT